MKVIPQCKVIGPYNYDRFLHVIKKLMPRDKIDVTVKRKDAYSKKNKMSVISGVRVISRVSKGLLWTPTGKYTVRY